MRNQASTIPRIKKITSTIKIDNQDDRDSDDQDENDHQADCLLDDKGAPLLRKLLDLFP